MLLSSWLIWEAHFLKVLGVTENNVSYMVRLSKSLNSFMISSHFPKPALLLYFWIKIPMLQQNCKRELCPHKQDRLGV